MTLGLPLTDVQTGGGGREHRLAEEGAKPGCVPRPPQEGTGAKTTNAMQEHNPRGVWVPAGPPPLPLQMPQQLPAGHRRRLAPWDMRFRREGTTALPSSNIRGRQARSGDHM